MSKILSLIKNQIPQEFLVSLFQTETLFSEEDAAYAAKALESRMQGYEDESPFLNAFVQEETQYPEPECQETESYYADQEGPGQIAEWERTLAPETGDAAAIKTSWQ